MNLPWLLINLFSNNNWIVTCNYKLNHVVILLFSNSNEYHESSNIQGIIESFTQEQNSAVSPVNDELTQDNINPAFNDDGDPEVQLLEVEIGNHEPGALPTPTQPSEPENRLLKVHRVNIKNDMMNAFKDPSIVNCDLTIVIIDSRGNEEKGAGVGVVRDALSLFWQEVYDSLFIGESEHYSRSEWEAIARVLVKGYLACQYLPVLMSKTFLSYVLFGESSITGPILIQSYFSRWEKNCWPVPICWIKFWKWRRVQRAAGDIRQFWLQNTHH